MNKSFAIPFVICIAIATYLAVDVMEILFQGPEIDLHYLMMEHNSRDLRLLQFINISWFALVFYSALLIRNRKLTANSLWLIWTYFAFFTGVNFILFRERYFEIISNTEMWSGGFNMSPFTGIFWIGLAALFTFLLRLALRRNLSFPRR